MILLRLPDPPPMFPVRDSRFLCLSLLTLRKWDTSLHSLTVCYPLKKTQSYLNTLKGWTCFFRMSTLKVIFCFSRFVYKSILLRWPGILCSSLSSLHFAFSCCVSGFSKWICFPEPLAYYLGLHPSPRITSNSPSSPSAAKRQGSQACSTTPV